VVEMKLFFNLVAGILFLLDHSKTFYVDVDFCDLGRILALVIAGYARLFTERKQ